LVADVENHGPAKNKHARKQAENSSHYFPFMQDIPAVSQAPMASLPQSDEDEQYDQDEIEIDH
jgi:hypothetical protein